MTKKQFEKLEEAEWWRKWYQHKSNKELWIEEQEKEELHENTK